MGGCLGRCAYQVEKFVDQDAWCNWSHHECHQYYHVRRKLGKGTFSEVVSAVQRDNGQVVALKVVFLDNPRLQWNHKQVLRNETDVMRTLNHPNIVKIACVIEDRARQQIVIAEELCYGGTLLEEMQAADNNNDRMLAFIFKQVLQALEYVHANHVLHRDLKPENVIFKFPHPEWSRRGAVPVLIDFGMATRYVPRTPETGVLGSPGFVAPEVIEGGVHTPAMDMYAAGVLLYMLITGKRPMTKSDAKKLAYCEYEAWDYPVMKEDELWKAANSSAKNIVLKLLERDPKRRLSAADALQHPWITADMRLERDMVPGLKDVATTKRLRLQNEAKEAGIEEMLQLMVVAMQNRREVPRHYAQRWRQIAATAASSAAMSPPPPGPDHAVLHALRGNAQSQSGRHAEGASLQKMANSMELLQSRLQRHLHLSPPSAQQPPLAKTPEADAVTLSNASATSSVEALGSQSCSHSAPVGRLRASEPGAAPAKAHVVARVPSASSLASLQALAKAEWDAARWRHHIKGLASDAADPADAPEDVVCVQDLKDYALQLETLSGKANELQLTRLSIQKHALEQQREAATQPGNGERSRRHHGRL